MKTWKDNYFSKEDVMRELRDTALDEITAILYDGDCAETDDAAKIQRINGVLGFLCCVEEAMRDGGRTDDADT